MSTVAPEIHKNGTKYISTLSARNPFSSVLVVLLVVASSWMTSLQTTFAFIGSRQSSSRSCTFARSIMKRKHDDTFQSSRRFVQGSASAAAGTSNTESNNNSKPKTQNDNEPVPLYRSEGIFAVQKPLNWTSNDVVSYIRGILARDARDRGAKPVHVKSRRNKNRIIRVGHGGTLDPLASGVLVIGVGKGTKELQSFLSGSKAYSAKGEFGFETTTLDMDEKGQVTKRAPHDHITVEDIRAVLPQFTGTILQVPPIYSAIQKGGKKMYEQAREGKTAEDLKLDARKVNVQRIELNAEETRLPTFSLNIECGGGTYVRSLIRDIGYKLDTVATMTALERTKQGQFTIQDALEKKDWDPDNIYKAIDAINEARQQGSLIVKE